MSDLSKISFGGTEYNVKDTTARTESAKKVTAAGGDISNTKITTADSITTAYPIPAAGDTAKGFLGKMKKFCEDIRNTTTGACFIGQIVNNCVTNNAKLPLSAAQGKVLMDLVTQLNADFAMQIFDASDLTLAELANRTQRYNYPFIFGISYTSSIAPDANNVVGIAVRGILYAFSFSGKSYKCIGENPSGWKEAFAQKDDLAVKVLSTGDVFTLPDGRYYCSAAVSNMPNSNYGYAEVSTWGDEKMVKVYDLKSNANIYINTYARGTWAGWTVK